MKWFATHALATTLGLAGVSNGIGAELSDEQMAALHGELMGELQRCWVIPASAVDLPPAMIGFNLLKSGALDGEPQVMSPRGNELEASAVRAILRCSPFASVTKYPDAFEEWREMMVNFDPSEMF